MQHDSSLTVKNDVARDQSATKCSVLDHRNENAMSSPHNVSHFTSKLAYYSDPVHPVVRRFQQSSSTYRQRSQ